MVKSNDAVLVLMQQTASASDPFTDLPAHVALVSSFLFWIHSDFVSHDNMTFYFIQLILNPGFFSASDVKITKKLSICETTVRKYRKVFKLLFLKYHNDYRKLSDDDWTDYTFCIHVSGVFYLFPLSQIGRASCRERV